MLTAWLLIGAVTGLADTLPFAPGEKLFYEVRWEQVPVARVSLEVRPVEEIRGEPAYHFVFRARTYPALDILFPVDGHIGGYTDLALTRSFRLEKDMREGWTRRAYRVDFDWDRGVANYVKKGKTRRSVALTDGTLDMLSILYYVRSLPLTAGMTVTRPLSSGKKTHLAEALVVRQETITVGGRSWPAFLIEPDVRKAGGIFKKSKKPRFLLWISADERRIPLRVVSKVWVGAFILELTDAPPEPVAAGS
ncbi:MAG: DUF3108 domain-containing protein [Deltaproteobacteria bacterium]|nr:DUF3108 domain-containing protein [Deltaproteobacteria bacterium]